MKIGVYGGEAFPVYSIHNDGFTEIDVDECILERWKEAFNAFEAVQEEIVSAMEEQGKGDKVWHGGTWSGFKK